MMKKVEKGYKKSEYDPSEWDESKAVAVTPEKRKRLSGELSTSIRLPKKMVNQLRSIAIKKGDIGYQTLIKIWLAERLEVEFRSKRRI